MNQQLFFEAIRKQFLFRAPAAFMAYTMFDPEFERIDHVAFRTFSTSKASLEHLEPVLFAMGYQKTGDYKFPEKHVRARSYSAPGTVIPRIFLSELLVNELSKTAQDLIENLVDEEDNDYSFCQCPYSIDESDYKLLNSLIGDYGSWVAVNGLMPNHIAVASIERIANVLQQVKNAGFQISFSGGSVKGGPDVLLEQGSTLADSIQYLRPFTISTAYCEFTKRWDDFDGFIEPNANKIFESTDTRESALCVVKPDGMRRGSSNVVLKELLNEGLEIFEIQRLTMTKNEARKLYTQHRHQDFFSAQVAFMVSGESMVIKLKALDCCARLRKVVQIIRTRLGTSIRENVIHGSDASENGFRETSIFFP